MQPGRAFWGDEKPSDLKNYIKSGHCDNTSAVLYWVQSSRHGARTVAVASQSKGVIKMKNKNSIYKIVTVGLLGALVFVSNYLSFPIPVPVAIFPVSTSATRFACLQAL